MAANVHKIVLTSQERSHHFGRRECIATEPLKVGRSVDRRRIAPNNLIFDCRVLSRNHALMWYEKGKFYIKDTKSSNGTFVNENRLSPSGEESGPVEIKSRDVVQFGVNVNVDKKVTHGCIIATVKLYMNDIEVPGNQPPVQQVLKMMESALAREVELEQKLASMQSVLNVAKELATDSMIAIVKEDELMSRLEMLENQLQVYSKNATDSELKKDLAKAFEEKYKNELAAKDSLRNMLQEKLECVSLLNQLQRDYDKAEQECQKTKTLYDNAKLNHSQEVTKLGDLLQANEKEKKDIENKLTEEKQKLTTNLESIQAEADYSKTQLEKVKSRLNQTEEELIELKITVETERQRRGPNDTLVESSELEVPPGTEDPPGSIIPPGTEEEPSISAIPSGTEEERVISLVPPGTEEELASEFKEEEEELVALDSVREVTASVETIPSSPARPLSPYDRRQTIIASPLEAKPVSLLKGDGGETSSLAELLMSLEVELRVSQGRVKVLEEQLEAASRTPSVAISSSSDEVLLVARRMSDTAITRGHIEVLQEKLVEAEREIEMLSTNQALLSTSPDSDGDSGGQDEKEIKITALNETIRSLQENVGSLQPELQSSDIECKRLEGVNAKLENELSTLNDRYSSQLEENGRIKSENMHLVSESEHLQKRIDEDSSTFKTSKHVRILTVIALVSIGVALASWLM